MLLVLKLTLVPLVLAGITLAGRRWGSGVAGLLAGLPVVAGPIVLLLAFEQGVVFGQASAMSALAAIARLLAFGLAYSQLAQRRAWPIALAGGFAAWLLTAIGLLALPVTLTVSLTAALTALLLTPRLLPAPAPTTPAVATSGDALAWRMIAGVMLTLTVTGVAAQVGDTVSGILASFPILGTVLAVSIHRARGAAAVATLYRGMVRGLYAFAAFFATLAMALPRVSLGTAAASALLAALLVATTMTVRSPQRGPGCPGR